MAVFRYVSEFGPVAPKGPAGKKVILVISAHPINTKPNILRSLDEELNGSPQYKARWLVNTIFATLPNETHAKRS